METGNKHLTSYTFKQEFYLKADNEQETVGVGLLSFVDVSRSGVQVLKVNRSFKALEFASYAFPYCSSNAVWRNNLISVLDSAEFKTITENSEINYSISDRLSTLIPSSLYSSVEKRSTFQFVFGHIDDILIQEQAISNSDAIGLFGIPSWLSDMLGTSITSSYLTWIDEAPNHSKGAMAHLTVNENEFSLVIFRDGKLVFNNWFQYSKFDDVLYFLMASLESLQILYSEVELILSGKIDKNGPVYSSLAKYISNIAFSKRPKKMTYSYSFGQLPEHRFPFIFAAACA